MQSSNGYFQHDPAVIAYAWLLVNEYIRHERKQDKLHPVVRVEPKRVWPKGGMIKNAT
jgi:hypothetical protein